MPTKTRLFYGLAIVLLLAGGSRAQATATKIIELWRSPFGYSWSVSQDDTRHTCWAATGGCVLRLSPDGSILNQTNGFWTPESVSANPTDGSGWVADTLDGKVVHLGLDGKALQTCTGFSLPKSVSVNAHDDSVWVADMGHNAVVHLAEDGTELGRVTGLAAPISVSVSSRDDSVWVAELGSKDPVLPGYLGSAVSHYSSAGVLQWRGTAYNGPHAVSVDVNDYSCWVADTFHDQVVHLSGSGSELRRLDGYSRPRGVSADRMHSSCWVADTENDRIVQLGSDYSPRSVTTGCYLPWSVSCVPTSSICWVADSGNYEVALLLPDGREQVRKGGFYAPVSVWAHPEDGDVWVADWGLENAPTGHVHAGVERVDDAGRSFWRTTSVTRPLSVSVLPAARTAWVADNEAGEAVNLSITGGVIRRLTGLLHPASISVSPLDSNLWVTTKAATTGQVLHLTPTGSRLGVREDWVWPRAVAACPNDTSGWAGAQTDLAHIASNGSILQRGGSFDYPRGLSINATDNSCWVADGASVVHVAADHAELSRTTGFHNAVSVSVNSDPDHDNGCWVADQGDLTWEGGLFLHSVVYLDSTGQEVCRDHRYFFPSSVAASEKDGTCWVADTRNGQLVHIVAADFADIMPYYWAYRYIGGCAHAGIVSGYPDGTYRPELAVARDAMAVYVARALAGGDDKVPSIAQYPTPSFTDVPRAYWAYRYIEYAKASGVVGGYPEGGYRPSLTVDRGQMAVFVSRAMAGGDANVPPDPDGTPFFPDVPATYWAYRYIEYCHDQGVVSGYDDGYHPAETVTRAQMAVYITRAFNLPMPR